MGIETGDLIIGPLVALFGFLGLFLANGARDAGMEVFGIGLVVFAVLFIIGQIRRHARRVAALKGASHHV